MSDERDMQCPDPRDGGAPMLDCTFEIESYGTSDSYFEPGDPPEFGLTKAVDFTGANVFGLLSAEEIDKIEEWFIDNFDWSYSDFDDYDPRDYA